MRNPLAPLVRFVRQTFARPAAVPVSRPARTVAAWTAAGPLPDTMDKRLLLDEGYRRNVVAYVCINEIATAVASLPVKVSINEKEVEKTHVLRRLLRRPNPEQGWKALVTGVLVNALATGEAYIHKARNAAGMPVELWNLRPDRMRPILDPDSGLVRAWAFTIPGVKPQEIPAKDVIRLPWSMDPLDDYHGLSPLAVAARAIDLDNKALDYLRAFFLNGAAPAGILTLAEPTEEQERERIRLMWKNLYGQGRGWHELAVLDAASKYQEIGSRPEKLGMDHIWTATETRICAVLGVPPIVVQLAVGLEASTFANYAEAKGAFWSETVTPASSLVSDCLTFSLEDDFSGEPEIILDLSKVEVLQEGIGEKRKDSVSGWNAGIIKLDEAREMWSLEPVGKESGGDEFKAPAPSPFGPPGSPDGILPPEGPAKPEVKPPKPKPEKKVKDQTPPADGESLTLNLPPEAVVSLARFAQRFQEE